MRNDDMKATTPGMSRPTDPPTDPQPAIVRVELQLTEVLSDLKHLRLWALRMESRRPWYTGKMKFNLQTVHYVTLGCASMAAGLPQLEAAFPPTATPWLKGASAVFILLTSVLGVFSPGAMVTKTS